MEIYLGGFQFPSLPEKINCTDETHYQQYNIIGKGVMEFPKGMNVTSVNWEGVFFGAAKQGEPIVQAWQDPMQCVSVLNGIQAAGTAQNLIVTDTPINLDVTIANFKYTPFGAFGNIQYTITLKKRPQLAIYTTAELQIAKTEARDEAVKETSGQEVKKGDSLWKIAKQNGTSWEKIYDANKDAIEAEAKKHGKSGSDNGHWIYPGMKLTIPT